MQLDKISDTLSGEARRLILEVKVSLVCEALSVLMYEKKY